VSVDDEPTEAAAATVSPGSLWPVGRARDGGIDRVPLPEVPGALWLCGKHLIGPSVRTAMERVDATGVVCLTERHELEDRYPDYVEYLRGAPGAVWYPIPDLHVPPIPSAVSFISSIVDRLREGDRLIMHCAAGLGRAGTMACGVLLAFGVDLASARATVAAARPMAGPQALPQSDFLVELADRFTGSTPIGSTRSAMPEEG